MAHNLRKVDSCKSRWTDCTGRRVNSTIAVTVIISKDLYSAALIANLLKASLYRRCSNQKAQAYKANSQNSVGQKHFDKNCKETAKNSIPCHSHTDVRYLYNRQFIIRLLFRHFCVTKKPCSDDWNGRDNYSSYCFCLIFRPNLRFTAKIYTAKSIQLGTTLQENLFKKIYITISMRENLSRKSIRENPYDEIYPAKSIH